MLKSIFKVYFTPDTKSQKFGTYTHTNTHNTHINYKNTHIHI